MTTAAQGLVITIDTSTCAFEDDGAEIARILRALAHRIEDDGLPDSRLILRDVNGNVCGDVCNVAVAVAPPIQRAR